MSNIIPPLLSDSPPPIIAPEDEEDEFGDFNSAVDVSYGYENLSLPPTPQHEPLEGVRKIEKLDINSNTDNVKDVKYKNHINGLFSMHIDKDFQDKRKSCDITTALTETDVNLPNNQCEIETVYNVDIYESSVISCNGDHQEDKVTSSKDVEDGVLPIESVPIDTLIQNQLLEAEDEENVHKSMDISNMKEEAVAVSVSQFSANVPCSTNENLLDTLKTDNKEINILHTDFSLNNKSEDTNVCNSSLESLNIVPNDISANKVSEKESTGATKERFYFIEEPPDLHVVDDSKVQVEDFCYYDAYEDEQDLEKNDSEVFNKTNTTCDEVNATGKLENAVESFRSPSEKLEENKDSHNSPQSENLKQKTYSNHDSNDKNIEKDESEKENIFQAFNENISGKEENTLATDCTTNSTLHDFNELSDNVTFPTNDEEFIANDSEIVANVMIDENVQLTENKEDTDIMKEDFSDFKDGKDTVDNYCDFQEFTSSQTETVKDNTLLVDDEPNNDSSEFSAIVDFAQFDAKFGNESTTHVGILEKGFTEISFSLSQTSVTLTHENEDEDDEFGDFGDYTQTDFNITGEREQATTSIPKMNKEDILKNVERIVSEMYPPCEVSYDQFVSVDVLGTDSVFKSAKDVTETNALSYQWTKSRSQDKLLNSLNIDTRNILYGPGWNPMMPRYAANLGSAPLQPIKSGDIPASPTSQIDLTTVQSSPPATSQVDIPNAQFDWSGSGLINPLDCTQGNTMLLDLEHLVASLDLTHSTISNTQPLPSQSDEFDEWENWLKSQPKDNSQRSSDQEFSVDQLEKSTDTLTPVLRARFHSDNDSVKSLQLTTDSIQDPEETTASKPETISVTFENENFERFTSYQSHKPAAHTSSWSNNAVPLRETHISRSRSMSDEFLQGNGERVASNVPDVKIEDGDEEFTDFQMGLPVSSASQKGSNENEPSRGGFGVLNTNAGSILQPVLEPLKPMVMTHVNREVANESAQINWPNPGITDADILNIELSYSRKEPMFLGVDKTIEVSQVSGNTSETSKQLKVRSDSSSSLSDFAQGNKKTNNLIGDSSSDNQRKDKSHVSNDKSHFSLAWNNTSTQITKTKDDDDDWSDFVCNSEPMKPPIQQKNIQTPPEKPPYTPEIRLSVPHLSQLQQPKKPIPVITPHGLIQTRIPSNINNLSNMNVQQPSSLLQNQFRDTIQPSTISQQYQSHMNGSHFSKPNVNGCYNGLTPQQMKINQSFPNPNVGKADDDDDWTEFISSPPAQQQQQQQQQLQLTRKTGVINFPQVSNSSPRTNNVNNSCAMPNIITNPVHFDYSSHRGKSNLGPYARSVPRRSPNVNFNSAASSIPSISALPDLDFVGSKGRTFTKK